MAVARRYLASPIRIRPRYIFDPRGRPPLADPQGFPLIVSACACDRATRAGTARVTLAHLSRGDHRAAVKSRRQTARDPSSAPGPEAGAKRTRPLANRPRFIVRVTFPTRKNYYARASLSRRRVSIFQLSYLLAAK